MNCVLILILIVVAVVAYRFYNKAKMLEREQAEGQLGQGTRQLESDDGSRTVRTIRLHDIVSYLGQDYMVEGVLRYDDDGWPWVTYMLVDGEDVRWLSVEDDDKLEVSLWEEISCPILGEPPEFIEAEGIKFHMVERGEARVTQQGQTGRKQGLSVDYFDYESNGEEMLSVERWGSEIEVSMGREIDPYGLDIFPGTEVG
jgi:hypothetical protein